MSKNINVSSFLEIEKKYELYTQEVMGVNYWNYCRFDIWNNDIYAKAVDLNMNFRSTQKSIKKNLKIFKYLFKEKSNKVPLNVDVLFLNHERRVKQNGFYECIYTEKLSEIFKNSVTIEEPLNHMHFRPVKTNNLFYVDKTIFFASIYWRFYKKFRNQDYLRIKSKIKFQMNGALEEFKNMFRWEVDEDFILDSFVNTVLRHNFMYKRYYGLLKKMNPKIIVEVVHYSFSKMIFNEVAKDLNIPTVELQHGIIYKEHIAYQYKTKTGIKQFPDKILLFSDFWKNNMNPPIEGRNLIAIGFPFFDAKLKEYVKKKKQGSTYTILFISQGTIGIHLSELAYKLRKKLCENHYKIIFKLHPSEYSDWKERYSNLLNIEIDVIDNSEKSIYYYFQKSDMQIGVYSTAIFEGIGFNLKTLVYKTGHYQIMESLVSKGYATYIENEKNIINIINSDERKETTDIQDFWKSNSLENLTSYLKDCIAVNKISGDEY